MNIDEMSRNRCLVSSDIHRSFSKVTTHGYVEHQQTQGLDGVDGGEGKQVQSEMVGTSAEGSKRKFEAVEEDDGVLEKRIRGSSNETEGLGVNPKPLGEE
uniref:Uncharacterized protein n=1 Tax=Brassica campestris TaxID=3711 RepID=M4EHU7_BRACM